MGVLKRVIAVLFVGAAPGCSDLKLGAWPLDAADIAPPIDVVTPPVDSGPACPHGQLRCTDRCVDLASDVANCGRCALACDHDEHCREGACH